MELGTRDGRGMCVCLVSKTMNDVRGAISILFAKNGLSLSVLLRL